MNVAVLVLGLAVGAGAAEASFSAHGSVEQVYATGLAAGAQASLLDQGGQAIATQRVNALCGILFRNVPPGSGYRVSQGGATSEVLTVLSTRPPPPDTNLYNQVIPRSGYGYMTTRDGTKLAIDVHPPTDVTNALPLPGGLQLPHVPVGAPTPTFDRVLGLWLRRPDRSSERDRAHCQPDGLHCRRRQHAWYRLFGRRVRLLRAASEP
ncbi:MAG: hypothetical protein ACR2ND_13725 [Solirubrobacteraceae bacterium]